jgi:hypothetical protein
VDLFVGYFSATSITAIDVSESAFLRVIGGRKKKQQITSQIAEKGFYVENEIELLHFYSIRKRGRPLFS